jgi:adenylate cyclase
MNEGQTIMSATRRKLTTIFSADVKGYTRLMEADEEGTLATLKDYRDAMGRLIDAHGGRVVNTWGDGLIAEFPSVVEAVRAAVDVQSELAQRNESRSSKAPMLFRIGINLGDVIAEGDDIYGDGVNIAARLQTSAAPGGIVISRTVYDQVRNKVSVGFDFLGALAVKNIDEGVPSYAVRIGAQEAEAPAVAQHFGRNPDPATAASQKPAPEAATARRSVFASVLKPVADRKFGILTVVMLGLLAINLLTFEGTFWAAWPLLAYGVLRGLGWARTNGRFDPAIAMLGVIGLGIVGINLLSFHGEFWAVWPLLALAFAAGLRWVMRSRPESRQP